MPSALSIFTSGLWHNKKSYTSKFNQYQVSKLCLLCRESDETLQHFILQCVSLQSTRRSVINALYELVGSANDEELLRLILDPYTAFPWLTRIPIPSHEDNVKPKKYLCFR